MSNKIIPYERSFASHNLKNAVWSKKNKLLPKEVLKGSNKIYYFDCTKCGHEYKRSTKEETRNYACPYCAHKLLCSNLECNMCYDNSFASHILINSTWSKKNNLSPREVTKASNEKYYFNCTICNHEYDRQVSNALKNESCSYCAHKLLCSDLECEMCYNNSFASHQKSKLWSQSNKGKPRDYFMNSNQVFTFDCDVCFHIYDMDLRNVCAGNECGYCYGNNLCSNEHCKICKEKSFANHPNAAYWSKKNINTARQVHKQSNKTALFDCIKCKHHYETTISYIVYNSNCPYCAHCCLCDDENCDFCYNNSFASIEKSKYWSDKNELKPRNYFKSSHIKFLFNCPDCNNIYKAQLQSVTAGHWCNCTINKTETKLLIFLQSIPNITIEHPKQFDWCKNKNYLPFDFCINNLKLIIELDGMQHFKQVQNWSSPEEQEKNDRYKMKMANENGYSIIRICQETVWNDNDDWKEKLKLAIKKYKDVINVFIGNIYKTAKIMTDHKYTTILIAGNATTKKVSNSKSKN